MELYIDKLVSDSVNADHAEVRHIIENAKSGDTFIFSKKEYQHSVFIYNLLIICYNYYIGRGDYYV